ncbi:MAG: hypothetical protein R2939_11115 [Kofleriaceae bacterium]
MCWGRNDLRQAAPDAGDDGLITPVMVTWPVPIAQVAIGSTHTCIRDGAGVVTCWGGNDRGQLGHGTITAQAPPATVALPAAAVQLAAGEHHSCARLVDRTLWCWGANSEGQLGQDDVDGASPEPSPVQEALGRTDWDEVDCGYGHTFARSGTEVFATGRNFQDQLGIVPDPGEQVRVLTALGGPALAQIVGGQNFSCGRGVGGARWCWGNDNEAQLGDGALVDQPAPVRVDDGPWRTLDVDTFHGCGLTPDGMVACWGRGIEGQLGTGDSGQRLVPTVAGTFDDWVAVSTGRFHSCGQRADASVWCTGRNEDGELGTGDLERRYGWARVLW